MLLAKMKVVWRFYQNSSVFLTQVSFLEKAQVPFFNIELHVFEVGLILIIPLEIQEFGFLLCLFKFWILNPIAYTVATFIG